MFHTKKIKNCFNNLSPLAKYLAFSVFVTVIDTAIVWFLADVFSFKLELANTAGVVTGFLVHYFLSSKSVFQTNFGLSGFFVYFITFVFGLFLANWLIVTCYDVLFFDFTQSLRFLCSKGVSVVIPFFVLYFVRKYLYQLLEKYRSAAQERKG